MFNLISIVKDLSTTKFVEIIRAVYMKGLCSFDLEGEQEEPTDGELLGFVIDQLGGAVFLDTQAEEKAE